MTVHDRPDPVELLDAVREFLAAPPGDRERLHRLVAANVVVLVQRELGAAAKDGAAHAVRLEELGVADDAALAELASRLDEDDPRYPALTAAMAQWARAKVAVVNPRYLEETDR
ncbi:MAG TPA: DUF6285 domain-containing protein [Nocardioides sp.]|nr:DUF6285 domain-containing protein [Nocardioides sp.]